MLQSVDGSPQTLGSPQQESYLTDGTTLMSWLNTRDHKRVGVMFLAAVTSFFLLGGVFAMMIRVKLMQPGPYLFDALTYNRLFTLHGIAMIFFFMIVGIPGSFGNFMVPLMLGARDVAFPRLNLGSFYVYFGGVCLALWGMIHGGVDTGWTFYTPYSSTTATEAFWVIMGLFVIGFSSIMTGINFIVTVHTLRAPGMTWFRMPLFVWAIYGTSVIQVLATPVLGLALLVVGVENQLHFGLFDPTRGGDPLLFQHLFWFYSHPAVYIMVLPAMGIISEVICTFSRKNAYGYKMIAMSSLGIAFVGFFAWGHHMFTTGQSSATAGILA